MQYESGKNLIEEYINKGIIENYVDFFEDNSTSDDISSSDEDVTINYSYDFSKETLTFLNDWLSGANEEPSSISDVVKMELKKYVPSTPNVTLFRGMEDFDIGKLSYVNRKIKQGNAGDVQLIHFDSINSWTYDENVAYNLSSNNRIFKITIEPRDIVLDTTLLDPTFITTKCSGFPNEKEVIIKAGHYVVLNDDYDYGLYE